MGRKPIMLSEQTIINLQEDRAKMSIRELSEKYDISVNTVQKYTSGIAGPKGPYKRKIAEEEPDPKPRFVNGQGKWSSIDKLLETLSAEKKVLEQRIKKLERAIDVLKGLA